MPVDFSINSIYPNPFNPSTTISFSLPIDSEVSIVIYDLNGQEVIELINNSYQAGYHEVNWNASTFPSGTYFVKIVANNFEDIRKSILIK